MRVRWATLDPRIYEQMVAVAISRLHPAAVRVDGSGGDAGRDVFLRDGNTVEIFELKSFTGRLERGRRAQVKRSLDRAREHHPRAWYLVVPIDPNPTELSWFDSLRFEYPFTLTWLGLTWLEGQMAAMPEIARYFCADANAEVVDLLRELREEQAAVQDARVAAQRAERLQKRLNEIDPHYSYSLTVGPSAVAGRPPPAILAVRVGDTRIDIFERYVGAAEDRPITFSGRLHLDRANAQLSATIEEAVGFGAAVTIPPEIFRDITIDAPAGLGSSAESAVLTLSENEAALDSPLTLTATVIEHDIEVASLDFRFTHRRAGSRGGVFRGADHTGCISATLRLDIASQFNLSFRFHPPADSQLPGMLRAAVHWLRAFQPNRHLMVRLASADQPLAVVELTEPFADWSRFTDVFAVVEALDDVQRRTSVYFPLPPDLSPEEANDILRAHRLFNCERVNFPWSEIRLTVRPLAKATIRQLTEPSRVSLRVTGFEMLELKGHHIPLGTAVTEVTARATNAPAIHDLQDSPGDVEIVLVPVENTRAISWLQPEGALPSKTEESGAGQRTTADTSGRGQNRQYAIGSPGVVEELALRPAQ
jgi:hypothetical protein